MAHTKFVLEIIGTIAFAMSGSRVAIQKEMDAFGVVTLGVTTAVGGGVLRDIILDRVPPVAFVDPIYVLVAVGVSLILMPYNVRKVMRTIPFVAIPFFLMDTIGLSTFTVIGISSAKELGFDNPFLLVSVGLITAVGGGVMRDCMANDLPFIFVKDIYATASLIGAIVCVILWDVVGGTRAMNVGVVIVILVRCISKKYKWRLPKAKAMDNEGTIFDRKTYE